MPNNILVPSAVGGNLSVDIREDDLVAFSPEVLDTLLRDHTTGHNIFWATHDYESLGDSYGFFSPILPQLITGDNGAVVKPRVMKSKDNQTGRSKDMAEVFTPSWICNAQNNLIDEAWFGRPNVFNTTGADNKSWKSTSGKIDFPDGKSWKDYVRATRLEITCGEAPYLVSRYDTTTGNPIPLQERIGLLDRKLRIVSENTESSGEWLEWAQVAVQNCYGYEWQGDSLLLARENVLATFIDYFFAKFGRLPLVKSVNYIAYIVSWNLWQMDGLTYTIPFHTQADEEPKQIGLFEKVPEKPNPVICRIKDWRAKKILTFVSMTKGAKA